MLTANALCLALNLFFEAGIEPPLAQEAVAHVTLNRARNTGASICRTVFAPAQFSWTAHPWTYPQGKRWQQSVLRAQAVLAHPKPDFTRGAWLYHRCDTPAWWRTRYQFVGQWGSHCFYR